MQQHTVRTDSASAISRYFAKAHLPTQQETLGEIVTEILKDGRNLSRKSPNFCTVLKMHQVRMNRNITMR